MMVPSRAIPSALGAYFLVLSTEMMATQAKWAFQGHHEKLLSPISARKSRVNKDMSPMERLRVVSNFSWCPQV